jgi:hypothetical protein
LFPTDSPLAATETVSPPNRHVTACGLLVGAAPPDWSAVAVPVPLVTPVIGAVMVPLTGLHGAVVVDVGGVVVVVFGVEFVANVMGCDALFPFWSRTSISQELVPAWSAYGGHG